MGVLPVFCLDALCNGGFALKDGMPNRLGFVAGLGGWNTGAFVDIRMLWGWFCPTTGRGGFEGGSAC